MKIIERIKSFVPQLTTSKNSMMDGRGFARDFFRNGSRDTLKADWSMTIMSDQDFYTGYPYAAINNRANQVAQLAEDNLVTHASGPLMEAAKQKDDDLTHPYLTLIDESPSFSNYKFWYDISTYLDLESVYYLLVLRNAAPANGKVGDIQEFKLLNPYRVHKVTDNSTGQTVGYVETKDGLTREIPPHMIIEMRKLNPFSDDETFSLADAAKDSQYTMKQAGDHTRHALQKNISAPGIITVGDTELALDQERLANFKARVMGHEKGEPIFGIGKGSIDWKDMQIDLDKAALDKINSINLEALIAVTGNSKTMFGIEQSGVTRDSSKVQKDLFISQHAIPQLRLIIDALNQDYKTHYVEKYKKDKYTIKIDSPLGVDRDAEAKDLDIREKQWEIFNTLKNKGYSDEVASKYVEGKLDLGELGEPTEEVAAPPATTPPTKPVVEDPNTEPANAHYHQAIAPAIRNLFDEETQGIMTAQQGALQNAIQNIESSVVLSVINKITKVKNEYEDQQDIITKTDEAKYLKELMTAITVFYTVMIPMYASVIIARRGNEFGLTSDFKMNNDVKKYIKQNAQKAAESHMNTILDDLLKTVREAALEGASQQEIINRIRQEHESITKNRAKAIARTETNRAFTQSQYMADFQFLKDNNLMPKAFKKWVTRSSNPCQLCIAEAAKPPIPFEKNFYDLGDTATVNYEVDGKTKVLSQKIDYEPINSGVLHVNCGCTYQLIIE